MMDESKRFMNPAIPDEMADQAILKEMKSVKEQIDTCPAERTDLLAEYQARYDVINEYAPQMMGEAEVEKVIKQLKQLKHCLTKKCDITCSHFDENGNLFDWWTKKDFENFEKLTKDMSDQWDGIPYAGDKVNGQLVVSENIADNGGLAVTIQIMHEEGNTDFDAYFKNYARIWCQKSKDEYKLFLLKNDVHSPAKLRVIERLR